MMSALTHSMRIRRTLPIFLTVILIVAAVAIAVQLRKQAPPERPACCPGQTLFLRKSGADPKSERR